MNQSPRQVSAHRGMGDIQELGHLCLRPPVAVHEHDNDTFRLKDTAGEFIGHFTQADPDHTEPADRLALVFYSSTTDPATAAGVSFGD